jgi:hypothetical protein
MTPKNLIECFEALKKILTIEEVEDIKASEDNTVKYHHSLGRWMRNNWGLWGSSELKTYFEELGFTHADDMSSIILDSFHLYLNNLPLDSYLEEQVKFYKDYWAKNP